MSNINLKALFLDLFNKQKYCDVKFIGMDSNGNSASIGAHKLILSFVSDVFDAMFHGELVHKGLKENVVEIPDIELDGFKLFLCFIYGEDVKFESPRTVAEFYHAADKYICMDALNFCKNYMIQKLDLQSSIVYIETAVLFNIPDLKKACLMVFTEKTKYILKSLELLSATPMTLEVIFGIDEPNVDSEMDFVEALERYINYHKDDQLMHQKIRPTLNCIRFLTLTLEEVEKATFLTKEVMRVVIQCLSTGEDLSRMPVGFSLNKNKRVDFKTRMSEIRKKLKATNICGDCLERPLCWHLFKIKDDENGKDDHGQRNSQMIKESGEELLYIYQKVDWQHLPYTDEDCQKIFKIFKFFGYISG